MDINQSVAKNIKKYRREKGLTQKQLADRLHLMNHSTVQKWEVGKNNVSLQNMQDICDALGISMEELMSLKRGNHIEEKIDEHISIFEDSENLENLGVGSRYQKWIRYVNKESKELIYIYFYNFEYLTWVSKKENVSELKTAQKVNKTVDEIKNIIDRIKNIDISSSELFDLSIDSIEAYNIKHNNDNIFYHMSGYMHHGYGGIDYCSFSLNTKQIAIQKEDEYADEGLVKINTAWFLSRILEYYGKIYDIIDDIYDYFYAKILPSFSETEYIFEYSFTNHLVRYLVERDRTDERYDELGYTSSEIEEFNLCNGLYTEKHVDQLNRLVIEMIKYLKSDTFYNCEIIIPALRWECLTEETITKFYNEMYDGKNYFNFNGRNLDKGCLVALLNNYTTPTIVLEDIAKRLPKYTDIKQLNQLELVLDVNYSWS